MPASVTVDYLFLRGINQFPHDYHMNIISHSASRITSSGRGWGMQVKFMTELKCGIFIGVYKINHDCSNVYCVV